MCKTNLKNSCLFKNLRGFYPNLIEEVFAALEIVVDLDNMVNIESDGFFLQVSCDGFFVLRDDIVVALIDENFVALFAPAMQVGLAKK